MFCDWKVFTGLYDAKQRCKERVPLISLIIAPIAIGPASHKAQDAHFTQLILNGTKSQSAQAHQLADIALPWRTAEEQAQHCCPHSGKQHIKNRHTAFHMFDELNSTALHSQVYFNSQLERRSLIRPDYFGGFDFALSSRCTASALRISGLPCAHALSIIMRLKRHFSRSRVSSQS